MRTEIANASNPSDKLADASRASIIIISFDEKGNVTEGSSFYPNGTLKSKLGWTYTYDSNGKLKERGYYNAEGNLTSRAILAYDNKDHPSEITFYNPDGQVNHIEKYIYDGKGNLIRSSHSSQTGSALSSISYSYNDNNRLIEESHLLPDGSLHSRTVYTYDGQGRKTGWTTFDASGNSLMGVSHNYDEKGNVLESRYYRNSNLASIETFTYKFDSRGNWIVRETKRQIIGDGNPQSELEVHKRMISYF